MEVKWKIGEGGRLCVVVRGDGGLEGTTVCVLVRGDRCLSGQVCSCS